MEPAQWERVKSLFASALERDPGDRESFLDAACGGDADLRREIESLLESDESSGDFIEQAPPELKILLPQAQSPASEIGKRVGAWELVRELGSGGMGTVYLAMRADAEFHKNVAVKLIRRGMESELVLHRFSEERQILAKLEHANIARLIDAGATEDGQPYIVMEYVEGQPIDRYCETRRLPIRERLALFRNVCAAVQCAHQSLIVHRDLKPGNILVTAQGQVKLLDFGIAKLLSVGHDGAPAAAPTRTGMPLMTLEYASPEQIRGEAVTTVSDVYSLGVILYQLLTGRYPYPLKGKSVWDIQRIVCNDDPVKPSVAVAGSKYESTDRAGDDRLWSQFRARAVSRQLRGDLDNIVLKAMSKEPSCRYASAEALSEDLRRYVAGEPVAAHPPTLRYRAVKFVSRNRTGAIFAALLLLSLTGGMIATSEQARQARRERERADNEAAAARAINEFLQNDLLAQASASIQARPDVKPDPDLKVRTALDRAAARIPGRFRNQPLLEASIRQTMGDTYIDLGLYPEARVQVGRALELRRHVLGDNHPDTLASMHKAAMIDWRQGKYAEAEPALSRVLERRRRVLGQDHPDTASAMNDLALLEWYRGEYTPSEALFVKTLEIRRHILGDEHADTLSTMNDLGGLYIQEGKYGDAEPLLARVLDVRRRVLGPEHPNTLLSMNNLAVVLWDEGNYATAEPLLTTVADVKQRVLGREHPDTLSTINNLAALYRDEGKYAPAEPLFTKVLDVRRRLLGDAHPDTLISMNNLGLLYAYTGAYSRAEPLLAKALDVRQRVLGEEHPDTLVSMNNLALLDIYERKYETAEPLYLKLLELQSRALGAAHPRRLASMNDLASLYIKTGKYGAAEQLLREAIKSHNESGTNTWVAYYCRSLLGSSLAGQARYAEAEPLLISGYEGMLKQKATMPWERRPALTDPAKWIVRLYDSVGKADKAAEWSKRADLFNSANPH